MSIRRNFRLLVICLLLSTSSFFISSCKEKDSKIQAAVNTEIRNNPDMTGLSASVQNGVVTLSGECKDEASKSLAESAIGKIKGVKQVINNCTISPPATSAPVVITADDALTKSVADATKDYPAVKASVKDGVITLTGEIKKAELQKLMMTLNTLKPKKIDNQLTIK
jgi:osmotically-inducible protein OsmY